MTHYAAVREENDWEGETWWTYFHVNEGNQQSIESSLSELCHRLSFLTYVGVVDISDSEFERLANQEPGYVEPHVFMKAGAEFQELCETADRTLGKAGIRNFGEDLAIRGFELKDGTFLTLDEYKNMSAEDQDRIVQQIA